MIHTSDSIAELSEALVKAQSKFPSAIKDATNPQYRSKYADLTSVIAATVPHLNGEGIAVMQHPELEWKDSVAYVKITTRLQHKSGQFIQSELCVPAVMRDRFDAQSVGSAITYGCRYGLQSIGVIGREDDDGTEAVGGGTREAAQEVAQTKIKKLKEELGQPIQRGFTPSLFYIWFDESQTAEITGDRGLMKVNEDLLKPLKLGGKLVANGDQLEVLKVRLEGRGVAFSPLKHT